MFYPWTLVDMVLFPDGGSLVNISCSNFQTMLKEISGEKAEGTGRKTWGVTALYFLILSFISSYLPIRFGSNLKPKK